MKIKENICIEDKELHIDKNTFSDIVDSQHANDNILVGICELGFCVRAKREIKAGEIIYRFQGETISFEETKVRGEMECMPLQFNVNKYIDTEAPGKYVNHSCEPNSGIKNNFDLIALQNIQIHEEIRFDYSTTMDEDHYQMECKCNKPSCRNIVTDFKLIPISVQKNYFEQDIVMDFIKLKYYK